MTMKLTNDKLNEYKDAFTIHDKHLKGTIPLEDVGTVMRMCGKNPSDVELEKIIKDVNKEGKSTLDFASFLTVMERELQDVDTIEEVRFAFKYLCQ